MSPFHHIKGIGDAYIPTQFRDLAVDGSPFKLFVGNDLRQLNQIFNHIRRGGTAILSGEWERIVEVTAYFERKKRELSPQSPSKERRSAETRPKSRPPPLMCWADAIGKLQTDPSPNLPYLLELVGENPGANQGCPFLIPIATLQKIQNALSETYPVRALDAELVASENVLAPRSQETIELFQRGLKSVKPHLPPDAKVLDMGCGCGCLTLLAAQELGALPVRIYASDLLPEAVATTRLNVQRLAEPDAQIHIMPPGDLFDPFSTARSDELSRSFALIIFNAPWVVSRARNRAEIAIHDEKQRTLRRFFEQAPKYLTPNGRILLGYADASGPKAIDTLEATIEEAGLTVANRFKERVATHRSKRKWENIVVYELVGR